MKTTIFFLLLLCATLAQAQTFKITRYEVKSDALFVCINSTTKPVYVEHFLTEKERKDSVSIKKTVERLIAELQIKEDKYIEPEKFISKLADAAKIKPDTSEIAKIKANILKIEKQKSDSIAAIIK